MVEVGVSTTQKTRYFFADDQWSPLQLLIISTIIGTGVPDGPKMKFPHRTNFFAVGRGLAPAENEILIYNKNCCTKQKPSPVGEGGPR